MASPRKPSSSRKPVPKVARAKGADDVPELSRAETRELDQRIKDLNDRTRYLLISILAPKFILYYNLSEDTYSWNEPKHATLFKRKAAALKIKSLLGSETRLIECRVDKRGQLLSKSVVMKKQVKPLNSA